MEIGSFLLNMLRDWEDSFSLIGGYCMKKKDKKTFKKEKDKKEPLLVRLRLGNKTFTNYLRTVCKKR